MLFSVNKDKVIPFTQICESAAVRLLTKIPTTDSQVGLFNDGYACIFHKDILGLDLESAGRSTETLIASTNCKNGSKTKHQDQY